ncbi:hypothetical protein HMPREF9062_2514, partial [Actinomyces sp. oral taxon 448 str. F0400]
MPGGGAGVAGGSRRRGRSAGPPDRPPGRFGLPGAARPGLRGGAGAGGGAIASGPP